MFNTSKELKRCHLPHPLLGIKKNELLSSDDDLLFYFLALLRKEIPVLPKAELDRWKKIVMFLTPHGVLPLLFYEISLLPRDLQPPKEITDTIRVIFFQNRLKQLKVDEQLAEILDEFKKNNLKLLPLKGVALGRTIYSDPVFRPTGDIDFLIKPEDAPKARRVMATLGYKNETKMYEYFRYFNAEEKFYYLGKKSGYSMVELHWDIHPYSWVRMRGELPKVLDRVVTINKVQTLHPVDNLVYLVIHQMFTHNQEIRLIWLYDIAKLAQTLSLSEGREAIQRSRDWQVEWGLKYCLELGALWFGLKAPAWASDLNPRAAERRLYVSAGELRNPLRNLGSPLLSFGEKARLLFYLILPPSGYMRSRYAPASGWQLPLAHVRRWWKLINNL